MKMDYDQSNSDYEEYSPEGYYDDYEEWDDYEADYWHEYIYNHMEHPPKKLSVWGRLKNWFINLRWRLYRPKDDIPF
jgi:hypothetical protein